jgi:8-oxo-dGTP pyrophosphatase MutT (NUDIX family)
MMEVWLLRRRVGDRLRSLLWPSAPEAGVEAASAVVRGSVLKFRVQPKTAFEHPLSRDEREVVRRLMDAVAGRRSWDGRLARLERLEPIDKGHLLVLSEIGFRDFLTTNVAFAAGPQSGMSSLLLRPGLWSLASHAARIMAVHRHEVMQGIDPKEPTLPQVLGSKRLANALAFALLIIDKTGRALLTERQRGLAVAGGEFALSATGSVERTDLADENPLLSGCAREASEELGLELDRAKLRFEGVVLARSKVQPVALFTHRTQASLEEICALGRCSPDYADETRCLRILDLQEPEQAAAVLLRLDFTSTTRFLLWQLLASRHGKETMCDLFTRARRLWTVGWGRATAVRWLSDSAL